MNAGLYIVGTPIGNLQDITLRALETLRDVSVILAEDTRQTRKLLDRHNLHTPMMSYHKFNEAARVAEIVERLRGGEALALVSDSGMPAVSDPGARIVAACREAELPVFVIPGPSAVTSAAALSGFPAPGFIFLGFLPHKPGARRRLLTQHAASSLPLILFESPHRILRLLDDVQEVLGRRAMMVGRELTKHFEECLRGTPEELKAKFTQKAPRGEFVVTIAPGGGEEKEKSEYSSQNPESDS